MHSSRKIWRKKMKRIQLISADVAHYSCCLRRTIPAIPAASFFILLAHTYKETKVLCCVWRTQEPSCEDDFELCCVAPNRETSSVRRYQLCKVFAIVWNFECNVITPLIVSTNRGPIKWTRVLFFTTKEDVWIWRSLDI